MIHQVLIGQQHQRLVHNREDDTWYLKNNAQAEKVIDAVLVSSGYRCPYFVILVLQTKDTQLFNLCIWRDQITNKQFSYLNYQLLFNTKSVHPKSWHALFQITKPEKTFIKK